MELVVCRLRDSDLLRWQSYQRLLFISTDEADPSEELESELPGTERSVVLGSGERMCCFRTDFDSTSQYTRVN